MPAGEHCHGDGQAWVQCCISQEAARASASTEGVPKAALTLSPRSEMARRRITAQNQDKAPQRVRGEVRPGRPGKRAPAPSPGLWGWGVRWGQAWRTLPAPCLPLPPQQGSTVDGSYSPKRSPGSKIDVMCALNTSPLKSILTALQGTPRPAMNIWSSVSKRARREPQSLNIYIYIRHRKAVHTFGW